ncbi:hypothetical protein Tsubulata_042780 [Turnera subulata]|uniref:Uncharacterized protein n=1 Tax=Turnera subulata TaxID=218843 RepID=A0A9Q0G384_9ROSI|nr:hypothetical protein Tsubulata_042780 [Turnera subulata]
MFGARARHILGGRRWRLSQGRQFCNKDTIEPGKNNGHQGDSSRSSSSVGADKVVVGGSDVSRYHEVYQQLGSLDFMKAAKIIFSEPPNKKKFGLDFHLVQLFFACLPSLAVYLVAQYARSEMKRMDAELAERKKREEQEKLREELKAFEEKAKSDPVIREVKVRLDKLEETVKDIVVESKKQSGSNVPKPEEKGSEEKRLPPTESVNAHIKAESTKSEQDDHQSKPKPADLGGSPSQAKIIGSTPTRKDSQPDQEGTTQSGKTS